ncbi:MAG: sel1 repeat family protein [Planctomycetes bacterium]|nr:sel1 repeat family protein [Planctomycetota bacterium]
MYIQRFVTTVPFSLLPITAIILLSLVSGLSAEDDSQQLLIRAQGGDLDAQLEMADRYYNGKGVPRSQQQVIWWLSQAAEGGHILAQLRLAQVYLEGAGTETSLQDAQHWFTKAAEQGSAEAKFRVAMMLIREKKNVDETVLKFLLDAAEAEYAPAALQLGHLYAHGQGVEQSFEQAYDWYLQSAAFGSAEACFALGECNELGLGMATSLHLAWHWYSKSAQADYALAQSKLGDWYMSGTHVKMSIMQAAKWFRRAAYKNDAHACFALGTLHHEGRFAEASLDIARYWYRLAAQKEYPQALFALGMMDLETNAQLVHAVDNIETAAVANLATAQVELGKIYELGLGRDALAEQAMVWYLRAAEQKNADGEYHVARCYQEAIGVDQDIELAMHWYAQAALQQHAQAQRSLGVIHQYGTAGIEINLVKAERWLRGSAEQGDVQGQYYLAENLSGQNQDRAARSWFTLAGEQGHADAQFQLGQMWELGKGGRSDKTRAMNWYQLAADQEHAKSAQALIRVAHDGLE